MHTVVPGWFGVSAVWFIPLIWRLVKSVLPGGAGLRGPGTIRLWLGFACVLVASCALEAMLVDASGFDMLGHALAAGLGRLVGHVAAPLLMGALFLASLPWLLEFRWRAFVAWADLSLGLGLGIRAARQDDAPAARDERRRRRPAARDSAPLHGAAGLDLATPRDGTPRRRSTGPAGPTVWRPPTRAARASADATATSAGAMAAGVASPGPTVGAATATATQLGAQPGRARTEPVAPAGWLREPGGAPRRPSVTPMPGGTPLPPTDARRETRPYEAAGMARGVATITTSGSHSFAGADPRREAPLATPPGLAGQAAARRGSAGWPAATPLSVPAATATPAPGARAASARVASTATVPLNALAAAPRGVPSTPAVEPVTSPFAHAPTPRGRHLPPPVAGSTAARAAAAAPQPRPSKPPRPFVWPTPSARNAGRPSPGLPGVDARAEVEPAPTASSSSMQETLRAIEENTARWTRLAGTPGSQHGGAGTAQAPAPVSAPVPAPTPVATPAPLSAAAPDGVRVPRAQFPVAVPDIAAPAAETVPDAPTQIPDAPPPVAPTTPAAPAGPLAAPPAVAVAAPPMQSAPPAPRPADEPRATPWLLLDDEPPVAPIVDRTTVPTPERPPESAASAARGPLPVMPSAAVARPPCPTGPEPATTNDAGREAGVTGSTSTMVATVPAAPETTAALSAPGAPASAPPAAWADTIAAAAAGVPTPDTPDAPAAPSVTPASGVAPTLPPTVTALPTSERPFAEAVSTASAETLPVTLAAPPLPVEAAEAAEAAPQAATDTPFASTPAATVAPLATATPTALTPAPAAQTPTATVAPWVPEPPVSAAIPPADGDTAPAPLASAPSVAAALSAPPSDDTPPRAPVRGHAPTSFEFRPPAASSVELPGLDLLDRAATDVEPVSETKLAETGALIEQRLQEFKVPVAVVGASAGPVITRFEVEPALGVRGSQIVGLMKDLSRGLGLTSIRVVETIPGKTCMGLELPNARRQMIRLAEILESGPYQRSPSKLTIAMGKDIVGHPVVTDLAKAPHMLVAGTTGSGKSVAINAMILSLLYKATPEDVRLIMIDPKMLELSVYEGIPHLLAPVVTDMKLAANALNWCVGEMEKRYRLMSAVGVRNLAGFNQKIRDAETHEKKIGNPFSLTPDAPEPLAPLPMIVVVIDELADLMMVAGKKIEELIARLAQKARAAGIHLILATQRPSVDVITGLIKANIPTRVAFQVSSKIDSRTILDQMGAESLLGQGDMLFLPPGTGYPQRVHGAFVADEEVHAVVEYLKQFGEPEYVEGILDGPAGEGAPQDLFGEAPDAEADPLYDEAVAFVVRTRRASISSVQRQLRIGYNRAARLVEQMEAAGLVSPMGINGSREVLAPGQAE